MDEKRILIIAGIVVIIVIVATFILLFSNAEDSSYSRISILGNGSVSENGTIDVKLANGDGVALKDKDITITLKDSEGNVVFNKTAKTYVNGVANVKLTNVSAGSYDVEATFAGDDNYTSCSVSEKLKIIGPDGDEEQTEDDNATAVDTTDTVDSAQTQSSQSYSSSSYQSQSYTPPSSSDDGGSEDTYYDENGHEIEPVIDENGNEVLE